MKTITVYELDELSAEARSKAIDRYRSINIEMQWYDYDGKTGFSVMEYKKFGLDKFEECDVLDYDTEEMTFNIESRTPYVQFDGCKWSNQEMARQWLGVPQDLWQMVSVKFIHNIGENTRIEFLLYESEYNSIESLNKKQRGYLERAQNRFDAKMQEAANDLKKQFAYEQSDEGVANTLSINYVFFADGRKAGRLED